MDEDTSVWSMLGKSAGLAGNSEEIEELKKRVKELEDLLSVVQSEVLGSIEALQRRLVMIEDSSPATSALDVMPVEELNEMLGTKIGEWPEDSEEGREDVTVVHSGLTYNAADDGLSMEEEVHSQMKIADMVDEEHPALLTEHSDKWEKSANDILAYIEEHGGVANADWKRKGLTPDDFEADDRKKVDKILRQELSVVKWNKNNIWHFYYKDGDDKDEALERAYGTRP